MLVLDPPVARALAAAITALEAAWMPAELPDHPEFHAYEPTLVDLFVDGLLIAQAAAHGPRYLEIGCGIGTKLLIAQNLGLEVTGIDCRSQYVATAKHLAPRALVEVADARGYDYRGFDIIFCARPLRSEAGMDALWRHLSETMKPAAVLFAPHADLRPYAWTAFSQHVWVR